MSDVFMGAPAAGATPDPVGLDAAIASRVFGKGAGVEPPKADPYADEQEMLRFFEESKKQCMDGRWSFERLWWRLLLYVIGRQWIYYDRKRGQWVDKRMADWMPRPVTNKMAEAVDSLVSMFQSIRLQVTARPIGNASPNVAAAEVADSLEPHIAAEHQMSDVMRDADFWNTVTGNFFLHPYWDKDAEDGEALAPYEHCETCGKNYSQAEAKDGCPECQENGTLLPATDDDGSPLMESMMMGRGRTDVCSPLEIALPSVYTKFDHVDRLIRMRWRPKTWYENEHPELVAKMSFGKTPAERSLQMLRSLVTQVDAPGSSLQSFGFGSNAELTQEGITEFELWAKPSRKYPRGVFMRVAGEGTGAQVVEKGPLPYEDKTGKPLWNWVHCGFITMSGRLLCRSPLELAIQKQDQINQLDALMQLIVQRMGNPIWLKPKGAEVRSFTGAPGLVVEWNPLGAQGAKPERMEGSNVQPSLFTLREQYLKDFEYLCGTFDVLKGAKPTGVEAFSTMQLLVERSQSRFTNVFKQRGEAYRKWYQLAIELEREFGPTERIISVTKPNRGFTYRHFENAKLQGAVQIIIEDGSQAPKTNLGRRAAIEQANQLRILNPQDPEQQYSILTGLGLADLVPSLDFQVKSALNEQDAFEEWTAQYAMDPNALMGLTQLYEQFDAQVATIRSMQMPDPTGQMATAPIPPAPKVSPFVHKLYHNPTIHFAEHVKWANSDKARELFVTFPVLERIFLDHLEETKVAEAAQMMGAGPSGGPPQEPQRGGPMERSNTESGATDTLPTGNSEEGPQGIGPQ
jgi:hypothetical protein